MPYCTQDDLEKLLPGAEIDSYLAVRYVLPLTETPAQVKHLAVDLAIYHLYSRRGMMLEIRGKNYDKAVAFLKDVAAGRAEIIGATGAEISGDAQTVTEVSSATRVFDRTKMVDF